MPRQPRRRAPRAPRNSRLTTVRIASAAPEVGQPPQASRPPAVPAQRHGASKRSSDENSTPAAFADNRRLPETEPSRLGNGASENAEAAAPLCPYSRRLGHAETQPCTPLSTSAKSADPRGQTAHHTARSSGKFEVGRRLSNLANTPSEPKSRRKFARTLCRSGPPSHGTPCTARCIVPADFRKNLTPA